MKTSIFRIRNLALMAALFSFTGCLSRVGTKQAPVPAAPTPEVSASKEKSAAEAHKTGRTLFIIERSNNANVVHYDARFTAGGELDPEEPVVAYWVLLAEDGRRKKLSWLEKKKAYGVRTKPGPSRNSYTLTLAAAPWLPLAVKMTGDAAHTEIVINGRPAILEKMFIQTRGKLLGPKVVSIELYGKDLQTGKDCREKILPKQRP